MEEIPQEIRDELKSEEQQKERTPKQVIEKVNQGDRFTVIQPKKGINSLPQWMRGDIVLACPLKMGKTVDSSYQLCETECCPMWENMRGTCKLVYLVDILIRGTGNDMENIPT